MAQYEHLPIFKAMMDLAVCMELVASRFSRAHKYTLGRFLRRVLSTGKHVAIVRQYAGSDGHSRWRMVRLLRGDGCTVVQANDSRMLPCGEHTQLNTVQGA